MGPPNVDRFLFFRTKTVTAMGGGAATVTLTHQEFDDEFGFSPDGVSATFGINQAAVDRLADTGSTLNDEHRKLLTDAQDTLLGSTLTEKRVLVSLLPLDQAAPAAFNPATSFERAFDFVDDHLSFIDALATELSGFQQQAKGSGGKRLDITVRYASEMNDNATSDQPYGRNPAVVDHGQQQDRYEESYRLVRERFRLKAPAIPFTFSAAIRSDIKGPRYEVLPEYWPGDAVVDAISCTWFVGQQAHMADAITMMRKYFIHRKGRNLPFGIDEMGGAKNTGANPENDDMLEQMLDALGDLDSAGIGFEYATLYLDGKFGKDVTLDFLTA